MKKLTKYQKYIAMDCGIKPKKFAKMIPLRRGHRITLPKKDYTQLLRLVCGLTGFELRWDEHAQHIEVRRNLTMGKSYLGRNFDWQPWNDGVHTVELMKVAQAHLPVGKDGWTMMSKERFDYKYLSAVATDERVNPIVDWIEGLPLDDSVDNLLDGPTHFLAQVFSRTEEQIADYGKLSDDVVAQALSRLMFIVPVVRALCPGYKCDIGGYLWGAMGSGKSTMLPSILPSTLRARGFTNSIEISADGKTIGESIMGTIFAELQETAFRANPAVVNKFFGTGNWRFREAYAKGRATDHMVTYFPVATGNHGDALPYVEGIGRRVLSVGVHRHDDHPERSELGVRTHSRRCLELGAHAFAQAYALVSEHYNLHPLRLKPELADLVEPRDHEHEAMEKRFEETAVESVNLQRLRAYAEEQPHNAAMSKSHRAHRACAGFSDPSVRASMLRDLDAAGFRKDRAASSPSETLWYHAASRKRLTTTQGEVDG